MLRVTAPNDSFVNMYDYVFFFSFLVPVCMIVAKKVEAQKGIDQEGYRVVIMIMVNMAVSLSITSIYTF